MQIKELMGINIYNFKTKEKSAIIWKVQTPRITIISPGERLVTRNNEVKYGIFQKYQETFFPSTKAIRSKR